MEDSSGSVIRSPEDDEIDAGDTSIQNSRMFSNSSPAPAVNSTTASTSRWLKGDLIDIGELVDVKQVLIDVDDVSEEKSQHIGWSCKCDGSFDRTLRIEIVSDYDTLDSFCDLVRPWNQLTIDTGKNYSVAIPVSTEQQIVDNEHNDAVGRTKEIISACNDLNLTMKCTTMLEVETLHICSPLLEAKSPFFRKLFSNGMRESAQLNVTLRINPSEKAALMELLGFMHTDTLRVTTSSALLDVLIIADKFEVTECMSYCCQMLLKLPMTCESSLLYLGLASGVLMAEVVQPLIVAAKQFLAVTFRDISKSADEIMKLPLVGIEAVLASDELRVASEDVLYDLILKWSCIHYPEIHERKDIVTYRLSPLIRFPFMSFRKLDEVLECSDMDPVLTSKLVVKALHFKAKASFRQQVLAKDTNHHLVQRRYKYQVVKIIDYAFPMQKCEVFMDLKRKDCEELFTTGRVDSEIIHLGGQGFFLSAHCSLDPKRSYPCFGMFLGKVEKGSPSCSIKYEISVMMSSSEEYACDHKGYCILPRGKAVGYRNFFGLHWKDFISDDFLFINDVLHVKCVLTMQQ